MIITRMVVIITKVITRANNKSNNSNGDNINTGIELKNQDQIEVRKTK